MLEKFREVIRDLSKEHDAWFVDLYRYLSRRKGAGTPPLTTDGIHLNDYGYWMMASVAEFSFNWKTTNFRFGITDSGTERNGAYGVKLVNLTRTPDGMTLDGQFEALPPYFAQEKKNKPLARASGVALTPFFLRSSGSDTKTIT